MKVHYLQHVPFEGLGYLETWLRMRGHAIEATHLYSGEALPQLNDFDWLIAMGGPMSVNDEHRHEWLVAEKRLIKSAIQDGKYVLGICLGAQLIASAFGTRVFKNAHREIGWFPVNGIQTPGPNSSNVSLPENFEAFHWHGETFDLPAGAVHLASSEGCRNQGFAFGTHVLALQFHLEATQATAEALIEHCGDEMTPDRYVQSGAEILSQPERFTAIHSVMSQLLDEWLEPAASIHHGD
jgi:GMP synthase-like glutamine amidotransferase